MSDHDFRAHPPLSTLVCVYYKVAASDRSLAIARVRDFQRTLGERRPGLTMEVLLRCEACPAAFAAAVAPGSEAASAAPAAADVTLMETYRLPSPAPSDPRAAATAESSTVAQLLADIESAAAPLAPLLRGPRHLEVFTPCAW
jgi:hypothetical protein